MSRKITPDMPRTNIACPFCGDLYFLQTIETRAHKQYSILRCPKCYSRLEKHMSALMSIADVDGKCVFGFDHEALEASKRGIPKK